MSIARVFSRLTTTLIAALGIGVVCFGQCETNSPDTTFMRDTQTTGLFPQVPGDVPSWVRITRVVGPGTTGENLSDGSLSTYAANTMKANGVLGRDAWVRLDGLLQAIRDIQPIH